MFTVGTYRSSVIVLCPPFFIEIFLAPISADESFPLEKESPHFRVTSLYERTCCVFRVTELSHNKEITNKQTRNTG